MTGVDLIAAERRRQIDVEGFKAEHDEQHTTMQLLDAALCYAGLAGCQLTRNELEEAARAFAEAWPWEPEWWKPSDDPVRNLVKAGALIAAEIDRLERSKSKANGRGDVHHSNDHHTG